MEEWLILFTLILILFLYIIACWYYPDINDYVKKNRQHINWLSFEDAYDNIQNGDLIFLTGKTRGEHLCCFFTDCIYSHVGMLFREKHPKTGEDVVYIWESDLGQRTRDGPRVIPLKKKLKLYRGVPYMAIRKLSSSIPTTQNIMNIVQKYQTYDFDTKMINWWVSESIMYDLMGHTHSMLCSELVAQTMKDLGMLGKKYSRSWYSPKSFTNNIVDGKCSYSHYQYVDFSHLQSQ